MNRKEKELQYQNEIKLFDDFLWVEKVIRSCKTFKQLYNADKLGHILLKKYKGKISDSVKTMVESRLCDIYFEIEDRFYINKNE